MKHLILGTAGHVDHGKTALVKALTGVDTDRLKEEKARGITIELGFARLELPGFSFGIVDVPGHEKFVRTMVSGAAGMDMVMLVIAADAGIMPQTREHMDILRLLGVSRGVVVLTRCDLVDSDWRELVTAEVQEFVCGSFLEHAPVVPVSARTGAGLDQLKRSLEECAAECVCRKREGSFRLPVDRVFTVPGFGTVVTGTLQNGELRVGDELELLPSGRHGKVRGLQVHGAAADAGLAGQRLAVNLQGVDLRDVCRGDTLSPRGVYRPTPVVDVRLEYLASAGRELKHRSRLRLHSAAYEVGARVILLDRDALRPGESAYAQLRLDAPVLLLTGDRYLLRSSSPAVTVGGGKVLDAFPPRRRRRNDEALQLLHSLDTCGHRQTVRLLIGQGQLSGASWGDILMRSSIPRREAEHVLGSLLAQGEVAQVTREPRTFLSREACAALRQGLLEELAAFHAAHPHRAGMGREELKTRLPRRSDPRFFAPLLTWLEQGGLIITDRDIVRLSGRDAAAPAAGGADRALLDCLVRGGSEPPTLKELTELLGSDEKTVRGWLAALIRNGDAVRVSGDLYYAAGVIGELRSRLMAFLQESGGITPPEFRELTGLSRKFLIPLLEYFDSEKVTIRVGDRRILRRRDNG